MLFFRRATLFASAVCLFAVFIVPILRLDRGIARANAVGGQVYGYIRYSANPLAGVRVDLKASLTNDPLVSTLTDAAGYYAFTGVLPGDYYIEVHRPSSIYTAGIVQIKVGSGDLRQDFFLQKEVVLLSPRNVFIVNTSSPLFCWFGPPEAVEYTFEMHQDIEWGRVELVRHIKNTCYRTTTVLQDGARYTWWVDAHDVQGIGVAQTFRDFHFRVNAQPVSVTVQPDSAATITSHDYNVMLDFPVGIVSQTALVTYTPFALASPGDTLDSANRSFYIDAAYANSGLPAHVLPGALYTLTVRFTEDESWAMIKNTLALYRWESDQWVKEPTSSVDLAGDQVVAASHHFTLWAVLGETRRIYLPIILR